MIMDYSTDQEKRFDLGYAVLVCDPDGVYPADWYLDFNGELIHECHFQPSKSEELWGKQHRRRIQRLRASVPDHEWDRIWTIIRVYNAQLGTPAWLNV